MQQTRELRTGKSARRTALALKRVSILIPVYNEAATLLQVLGLVANADTLGLEKEVIIVDDASTDGTRDILAGLNCEQYSAQVIMHESNRGKGAALRTALAHVTGDVVLVQDADLEYSPTNYARLLHALIDENADVVYGSRLMGTSEKREFKILSFLANRFLSLLTNVLYQCSLTDMETCYKAIRTDVMRKITIRTDRFEFEPEITAKLLKQGVKIIEIPISYFGRGHEEGKKITWIDGLSAIWTLVKYRFMD